MSHRKRNYNIAFYILIFFLTFADAVRYSQVLYPLYQYIEQIITIAIIFLMIAVVFTSTLTRKKFILFMLMGIVGVLIYVKLGRMFFLYMTVVLLMGTEADIKKVGHLIVRILGSVFGFNILCTFYFGLFDKSQLYIRTSISEPRPQLDLSCGGHPNHAACMYVFIVILICYLYWEKLRIKHFVAIGVLTIIIYLLVGSEALLMVVLLPICWGLKNRNGVIKFLRKIVQWGIPIALLLSLILVWSQYIPGLNVIAKWMNDFSSGRFGLSIEAINRYSVTFFGADTQFGHIQDRMKDVYVYADNAYVYMLINSGIIYLIILEYILYCTSKWMDMRTIAIVLVYLCYGMAESNILSMICIYPILVAVNCKWNKKTITNATQKEGGEQYG